MKKLIVSVLSACVLCPAIASAEMFDLVCTFDKRHPSVKFNHVTRALETNDKIEDAREMIVKFKIESDESGKISKAWDEGGEVAVTPVLNIALRKNEDRKNADKTTIRLTASETVTVTTGIFTEVITGYHSEDGVNPALYILSWPDGYHEDTLYSSVYGGKCEMRLRNKQ